MDETARGGGFGEDAICSRDRTERRISRMVAPRLCVQKVILIPVQNLSESKDNESCEGRMFCLSPRIAGQVLGHALTQYVLYISHLVSQY